MKYELKFKMVFNEQEASSRKVLQRQLRTAGGRQSLVEQSFMVWGPCGQGHIAACLWLCQCNIKLLKPNDIYIYIYVVPQR